MTPKPRRPRADYSMIRVRSPRNSRAGSLSSVTNPNLIWTPAKKCWKDGPSMFGTIYLKVPFLFIGADPGSTHARDYGYCRVYPRARIGDVEALMLHEGEWYWIVRRNRGRRK